MPYSCVLAGTHSGCGKTTFSLGLLRLLSRNHWVKPFKVGPDFIDPAFHEFATGVPSSTLDVHLMGEEGVRTLFRRYWARDRVLLVEGVMGLYDGIGATTRGSTAEMAKLLNLPVVLIVDAGKMAASAAAVVKGFQTYDRHLNLTGVVLNRVGGNHHYQLLRETIIRDCGVEVFGYLPQDTSYELPEQHLGLVTPYERGSLKDVLDSMADQIMQTVDVETLLKHVYTNKEYREQPPVYDQCMDKVPVRVGIARDRAFHFYYPDSLRVFEELGCEWVDFSPLSDSSLPVGIGGVYLGGGYPEVFSQELIENSGMIRSLRRSVKRGMPVYAECGGYVYLSRSLTDMEGRTFPMAGIFPGDQEMTSNLAHFGYVDAETVGMNPFASGAGIIFPGHEYHHSHRRGSINFAAYRLGSPDGLRTRLEGERVNNALGSFVHLHFFSQRKAVVRFLDQCRQYLEHFSLK